MNQKSGKNSKWNGCSYREKRSSIFVKRTGSQGRYRTKRRMKLLLANAKLAQATWGAISTTARSALATLTKRHGLSVAARDLQFLDGRWYVTHSGLLRIAHRKHCFGIRTELQKNLLTQQITVGFLEQRSIPPLVQEDSSATAMLIRPMSPLW